MKLYEALWGCVRMDGIAWAVEDYMGLNGTCCMGLRVLKVTIWDCMGV